MVAALAFRNPKWSFRFLTIAANYSHDLPPTRIIHSLSLQSVEIGLRWRHSRKLVQHLFSKRWSVLRNVSANESMCKNVCFCLCTHKKPITERLLTLAAESISSMQFHSSERRHSLSLCPKKQRQLILMKIKLHRTRAEMFSIFSLINSHLNYNFPLFSRSRRSQSSWRNEGIQLVNEASWVRHPRNSREKLQQEINTQVKHRRDPISDFKPKQQQWRAASGHSTSSHCCKSA